MSFFSKNINSIVLFLGVFAFVALEGVKFPAAIPLYFLSGWVGGSLDKLEGRKS